MFTGCSALVDASDFKLSESAIEHGTKCYYEMFKDCTSLANPPEKVVFNGAGSFTSRTHRMFANCSSLA